MMRMYCMHTWRLGNLYTCHRYRSWCSSREDFEILPVSLHSVDYVTDASISLLRKYKYPKITSVVGIETSSAPDHALYSTPWDDYVRYESIRRSSSMLHQTSKAASLADLATEKSSVLSDRPRQRLRILTNWPRPALDWLSHSSALLNCPPPTF